MPDMADEAPDTVRRARDTQPVVHLRAAPSALSANFRAGRSSASTSLGRGLASRDVATPGQSLRSFPQRYSFRRQPRSPAPRRPGTRPGPCTAPRPSAGCGRPDGGRRSRPRRNDGGRATRRQAFSGHPVAPLHDHPSDLGGKLRREERHAVNRTPVFVSVHVP